MGVMWLASIIIQLLLCTSIFYYTLLHPSNICNTIMNNNWDLKHNMKITHSYQVKYIFYLYFRVILNTTHFNKITIIILTSSVCTTKYLNKTIFALLNGSSLETKFTNWMVSNSNVVFMYYTSLSTPNLNKKLQYTGI